MLNTGRERFIDLQGSFRNEGWRDTQGPCCHDALSAKLIEQADFDFAFMSGFCTSAAYAGLPDTGLMSYAEMLHVGRCIHESTSHIPVIGDGDTGYGNAVNVKRTVNGYASAGFAGAMLFTHVWSGHRSRTSVLSHTCDTPTQASSLLLCTRRIATRIAKIRQGTSA